jgi:hypothetical protein
MEMARETKLPYDFVTGEPLYAEKLEAFAESVRADERNKTWTPEHWTEYERSIAATEREACHALRQTLSNPHEHCQVSAHAYDMAIAAYGAAIRARGNT